MPMTAREVLDAYFIETRAKLLEIAATLDRIDRAPQRSELGEDARLQFIHDALTILQSSQPRRAEQIQKRYSKA